MTEREFLNYLLIENNKVEAPSLLIEDYEYISNKAVQQYINKVYNRYDINQQATDYLSYLKTTAILSVNEDNTTSFTVPSEGKTYVCALPSDYMHLLNCVVGFVDGRSDECNKKKKNCKKDSCSDSSDTDSDTIYSPARRLESDKYPSIIRNAYLKPSYERPYYFITNAVNSENQEFEDMATKELNSILNFGSQDSSDTTTRYSNRMELRCGKSTRYIPTKAYVDYIRRPKKIVFTQAELDGVDTSRKLEFPDYVCYEIINIASTLILENASDPRLETHPAVNQSILTQQINKSK